ncbi:MAG: hypothetical protein KDK10_00930 [Maritimibacter sp.]|nr:hypothetical protein [Maritimibacter sp.]
MRGISGSVLHFIDESARLAQVWAREFGANETPADACLTRIDLLAQTMSYDDMLSWTLFYGSIFDMAKQPIVDVFDPDELVRSQVVESPGRALRITLNGADSHRTLGAAPRPSLVPDLPSRRVRGRTSRLSLSTRPEAPKAHEGVLRHTRRSRGPRAGKNSAGRAKRIANCARTAR